MSAETILGQYGEKRAKKILRQHFTNVRFHTRDTAPFDYTATDRLTGDKIAIEVKTVRKEHGKLVHIENEAMSRKLNFLNDTNRKGIVMVIVVNGSTHFYFAKLQQHISRGALVEVV